MTDRRRLAVDLFNEVWRLLRKPDRTREEDFAMIHAAHASRYHWGELGKPVNLIRGEWQVSRVYATLGRAEPSLYHAERCLELCRGAEEIEDWDLPFAYEAMARAQGIACSEADTSTWAAKPGRGSPTRRIANSCSTTSQPCPDSSVTGGASRNDRDRRTGRSGPD